MIKVCKWCGVPVRVSLLETAECDDQLACVDRQFEQAVETAVIEPPEPEWEWWRTFRPADLEVCPTCQGRGRIMQRRDWATGAAIVIDCPSCNGGQATYPWV